jgi:predicted kinase|tara:strand:+ start:1368 stop:2042 length:675 start_codon:yes stop_codon:yes gene_type:complete
MSLVDKFKDFIDEGVNDPGIFKAIYMAGGPGSGKSYVAKSAIPKSSGLKLVNSDELFELGMKKSDLDFKMPDSEKDKRDVVRSRAKQMTGKRQSIYMKGRLGLVIDGTGKDFNNIKTSSDMLKSLGYDAYMIFVNTSLEVALERNAQRPRSLPEPLVTDSWNRVQNNIGKFQNYFGAKNMLIVDNNNANEDVMVKAYKQVQKFIRRPVQNKTAKDWIKQQKEIK